MGDLRFTLDEIRRALHLDHFGEGRSDPDDLDEREGEYEHQRAEEQFKRLQSALFYCRDHPDAFALGSGEEG